MTAKTPTAREQPERIALDTLRERFETLGLHHAAEALTEQISEGVKHDRPAHSVLDRLLATELSRREERRVGTSLKLSNLPGGMTLAGFDYGFQPGIDRKQIETLATCAFVRERANLILQGPPGVGKTHLVAALGIAAIEHGFGVAFYRLEDLLHEMRKDAAVPPAKLRRKKYFSAAYVAIDEVGFEPMTREDACLFFRLVSYRYMRGSTAITTNKSIKDWPGIFAGDEAMTAAVLDRLLHKSHVLNIRGRSYRLQELERMLK